jgi:hypothetical protein
LKHLQDPNSMLQTDRRRKLRGSFAMAVQKDGHLSGVLSRT